MLAIPIADEQRHRAEAEQQGGELSLGGRARPERVDGDADGNAVGLLWVGGGR